MAALGLLAGCGLVSLSGQRSAGARRIGFLASGGNRLVFEAFRDGLRELGYVEGQNLLIELRDAELNTERLPVLAAELVGVPVEVIVAQTGFSVAAASHATSSIPIVAAGGNVVASGLVTNVARPAGNITGVTTNNIETIGKWIELLKETVPSISHVAAILDPSGPAAQGFVQQLQRAADTLQIQFAAYDLPDLDQLPVVLSRIKADGADGLVWTSGPLLGGSNGQKIGGEVLKSRLPAVAELRDFAVNGGLLAHGTNNLALARRSASFVDKILKGAKPGDLPIDLPTTFDIVVNKKAADALGLTIPQSVLQRATEVIQ